MIVKPACDVLASKCGHFWKGKELRLRNRSHISTTKIVSLKHKGYRLSWNWYIELNANAYPSFPEQLNTSDIRYHIYEGKKSFVNVARIELCAFSAQFTL